MIKHNFLFVILGFVIIVACNNNNIPQSKLLTARRFIKDVRKNNLKDIKSIMNPDTLITRISGQFGEDLNTTNGYFEKYGVPSESKWYIEYDTMAPILKLCRVVIPIREGTSEDDHYNKIEIKLGFDYTGHYLPDTIIADFELFRRFKWQH